MVTTSHAPEKKRAESAPPDQPQPHLPAEWEKQDAILLAWPHDRTIWEPEIPLEQVQDNFYRIIEALHPLHVFLAIPPDQPPPAALPEHVTLLPVPTNDCWIRDFGPLSIYHQNQVVWIDFRFDGWNRRYPAGHDNAFNARLGAQPPFQSVPIHACACILEGGSIESNGAGMLLTTENCLLHRPRTNRKKSDWERDFARNLGIHTVNWLKHGKILGDDTDGHIDQLARFAPGGIILHAACDDPADAHFAELQAMRHELATMRQADGRPFSLHPLYLPRPILAPDGRRLPASYANFLITNHAVLLPIYGDPEADSRALDTLAACFPDRRLIPVDCRPLIHQHGSLHCVTMQVLRGTCS